MGDGESPVQDIRIHGLTRFEVATWRFRGCEP